MTVLLYVLGVVVFILAILVSIGLHEFGHLIPAKAFGGRVTQYFVGFGPTIWSKQIGETEYGLKAIPLGGYVKIVGMLPPAAADLVDEVTVDADGNRVQRIRKSNTGLFTQLISDARAAEYELVRPEDSDRLFYKMAWWKKVVVMAAGPTVNLVIAFVLFWMLFGFYGLRSLEPDPGPPVVDTVSQCILPADSAVEECPADAEDSPAVVAGLEPGDVITSFNGTPVRDWGQLRDLIRGNAGGDAVIGYERDGVAAEGETSTTVELRPDTPGGETLREVGFLGVTPVSSVVVDHGGPIYTLDQMGDMTVATVEALGRLPVEVYQVGRAVLGLQERSVDSPVSIVGGGRFAGETASDREQPVADRVAFVTSLVAGFNLFIALFNFIPLLPLDGGHIASALWEALRRGLARVFRRPDPGYVDAAKLLPVAYVVAGAMLVMGVVLIIGDLVVPIDISG